MNVHLQQTKVISGTMVQKSSNIFFPFHGEVVVSLFVQIHTGYRWIAAEACGAT